MLLTSCISCLRSFINSRAPYAAAAAAAAGKALPEQCWKHVNVQR
jgi:hypothetical protein